MVVNRIYKQENVNNPVCKTVYKMWIKSLKDSLLEVWFE